MKPEISVVTTLYMSAPYLLEFVRRTIHSVEAITENYEVIFVSDGPTDNAPELVKELSLINSKIRLIELSRNFGHHNAIMAGLEFSNGSFVFIIDSDLEESPEDILVFYKTLQSQEGIDSIYGYQENRKGGLFEKISGWIFYSLLAWISDFPIRRNIVMSRLMTRNYVDKLLSFTEREFIFAGLIELLGFSTIGLPIKKLHKGSSTYTLKRKIDLFVNAVTSMSAKPLWLIFKSGITITAIAFSIFAIFLIRYFIGGPSVIGWPSLILSIWMIGGIIISFLGIIAVYLSKIFSEVKGRPRYIVSKITPSLEKK